MSMHTRRMIILNLVSLMAWEISHIMEVESLIERKWSCYGSGQFNEGRMVMLQVCVV